MSPKARPDACPSCGAAPAPDARFCAACGTDLRAAAAAARDAARADDRPDAAPVGDGPSVADAPVEGAGTDLAGIPADVRAAAKDHLKKGVAFAAVTFLSLLGYLLVLPFLLLVAVGASVLSLLAILRGWGLRHGAPWTLDRLPAGVQARPDVQAWFWGDEHCAGCGGLPGDVAFCPDCGHPHHAPDEDLLDQVGFVFRRLVAAQPVEPPRTQAFREREAHETTDRFYVAAVGVAALGYALTTFFSILVLDVLGVAVATLVPALLVLAWLRGQDRFEPEPWSLMLLALAWGVLSGLFVIPANSLVISLTGIASVAGVTEELAKAAIIILIANHRVLRKEFNGPTDGLVYGACAGLGFAAMENVQYVMSIAQLTGGDILPGLALRSALMFNHMFWTGITGGYLGLVMLRRGRVAPRDLLVGFLPAAVLHGLNNADWSALLGGFSIFLVPVVVTVSAYAFFKLLADALRDEAAWGYAEGRAPVEARVRGEGR